MARTRAIQVRVDREEYNQVRTSMRNLGYTNISAYLRDVTLEIDLILKKGITQINDRLNQVIKQLEKK